jgi:hypothetical protein
MHREIRTPGLRESIRKSAMCALAVTTTACSPPTVLTPDAIATMEQRLQLPAGAGPIGRYARYYANCGLLAKAVACLRDGERVGDKRRRVVAGRFVDSTDSADDRPGAYVVSLRNLPRIYDGGCEVVDVSFDLTTGETLSAACNDIG